MTTNVTIERKMKAIHPYFALAFAALFTSLLTSLHAQEASDIYLGKLNLWHKQPITDLVRVTDTDGYTNQPYFFGSGSLYFTQAVTKEQQSQMDIFKYQLSGEAISNVTQSPESEYSPTPLPKGSGMSVIRVNAEGKQELWTLDDKGQAIEHLVPAIEPVGYQVWINNSELLLFVLGEPQTLQRVSIDTPDAVGKVVDSFVGASLYQFENSNWFLYSQTQDGNLLKAYNAKLDSTITVTELPEGSQYFSVSSTGHIITSDGNTLYHRQLIAKGDKLRAQGNWERITIDGSECQSGISRTALSHFGDKIALVCTR
jgi:hypothetical protein